MSNGAVAAGNEIGPADEGHRVASRWLRFYRRHIRVLPVLSGLYLLVLIVACFVGPKALTGYDPNQTNYDVTYIEPSKEHLAGTDSLGRDMASRLIEGGKISLKIAGMAALISLFIGVLFGGISGYAGGRWDALLMRAVDILYGVPTILVVILLMVYLDQGIRNIYIAIGMTYWLNIARLTRAQVLDLKSRDFVEAARTIGRSGLGILFRHILPNAAGVIVVSVALFIPEAIFLEAFLSYIGLGVPAPEASWGTLASEGAKNLRAAPYLMLYPAAAICLTMLAINIVGDAMTSKIARRL